MSPTHDAAEAKVVSSRSIEKLGEVEAKVSENKETLQKLYEAQKVITAAVDLQGVVQALASTTFDLLPRATHCLLALAEGTAVSAQTGVNSPKTDAKIKPDDLVVVGSMSRSGFQPDQSEEGEGTQTIPVSQSVIRRVLSDRASILAAEAKHEVEATESLMAAAIRSTMGVPLWHGEDILGVFQVDNRDAPGMFQDKDLDLLSVLVHTATQSVLHARMFQELLVSREDQEAENAYLRERVRGPEMIAESDALRALLEDLHKVVETPATVLIEGETGSGKELIANFVHDHSNRNDRLFVAQNCAALPEQLLESELFGHKRGAFTGATEEKKGLFEVAHKGTLFLDEIGEMPLTLQAKLLRVLQEGEIRPVGSSHTRKVDVRIVAATNRSLEQEVKAGKFREDLYYRLRVFPVRVPPLRERRADIVPLAQHFLRKYASLFGRRVEGLSQETYDLLRAYDWPGNVRELENEVQRLVIQVVDRRFVQPEDLSPSLRGLAERVAGTKPEEGTLKERTMRFERWVLAEALAAHGNNKSATAKTLGITREGLHKKLKSHGLG